MKMKRRIRRGLTPSQNKYTLLALSTPPIYLKRAALNLPRVARFFRELAPNGKVPPLLWREVPTDCATVPRAEITEGSSQIPYQRKSCRWEK